MIPDLSQFVDLGGTVIVAVMALWAIIQVSKIKKSNGNGWQERTFKELQAMNSNHLHDIQNTIRDSGERMVDAVNRGNEKIVELLGEIKGNLMK